MEDDSQLRRQITQATCEKESARTEIEALKRTIDGHLVRLGSLLSNEDVSQDRLTTAVQAFDADLRSRLEAAESVTRDASRTDATNEALRHSLDTAQRKCQVLNNDMLKAADVNEELMSTFKALQNSNKRLVEEVQKQTEELRNLTQARIQDMDNITRLEESFKKEEAMWQADARRLLEQEQAKCDEECNVMRTKFTTQLEDCWQQARVLSSRASGLRAAHSQVKAEMVSYRDNMRIELKNMEHEMLEKIGASAKHLQEEHTKLCDMENSLQAKLRAEREVRELETETWRKRQAALTQELEEIVARRDREISDLRSKVDATMTTREAEAIASANQRAVLQDTMEALAKDIALFEAKSQTAKQRLLQLGTRLSRAEQEREQLQGTTDALRQQIRESEEALNEAVRNNEAIRKQMEEQIVDAKAANERDLRSCREMYERRLQAAEQAAHEEQTELAKKIRDMEDRIGTQAGEVQALKEEVHEKTRKRDALQRDVLLWKGQHELAAKMRADVEHELVQFRQECINGELHQLQEKHDELQVRKGQMEKRKHQVIEEAKQAKRTVQEKEATHSHRARQVREKQLEVASETERTKAALAEVEAGLATAKADFASMTQQMTEARDTLEQEIARLSTDFEAEKADLERQIQAEKAAAESVRDACEKLRTNHRASYKAALDGPAQHVYELEGTISQIQQNSDAELAGLKRQSDKLKRRVEELEVALQDAQSKLAQTEQEVQDGTTRLNHAKANHRTSRQNLEREKALRLEELEQVRRSVSDKSEQLKYLVKAGEEQRKRLLRNIEEAKLTKAREAPGSRPLVRAADRSFSTEEPWREASSFHGASGISNRQSSSGATPTQEASLPVLSGREGDAARRLGAAPGPVRHFSSFQAQPGPCNAQQYVREPVVVGPPPIPVREPVVAPSAGFGQAPPGSLHDFGMQRNVASMEARAATLRHELQR
mmetsp:Transcript_6354/g.15300  ORF Transcript_6354/g.15300 Transcript_6354/m.15300 type:complete len:952 (+) Transcript_6354:119-2974(+)